MLAQVYRYQELNEQAKRVAYNFYCDVVLCDWYETVYEDIVSIGAAIGITIHRQGTSSASQPCIWFDDLDRRSSFQFDGDYRYKPCFKDNLVKAWGENWHEYKRLAEFMEYYEAYCFNVQKPRFYDVTAGIESRSSYYGINVFVYDHGYDLVTAKVYEGTNNMIQSFCEMGLKMLREEYDYLTQEEQVAEFFDSNEYYFTCYGDVAGDLVAA